MGFKRAMKAALKELDFGKVKAVEIAAPAKNSLLADRLALVSGGTGGIGAEVCRAFANAGCCVVLCGTDAEKAESACCAIGLANVRPMALDVADAESLPAKVEEAASLFPELPGVGILANCAGVGCGGVFGDTSVGDWDDLMDVNLKGSYFLAQAAFNHMRERGIEGNILNVSSSSALRNAKSAYEISKWGVKGMTLGMAEVCVKYGIVVNAIGPGPTATAMLGRDSRGNISHPANPSGRLATPQEIAALALMLVSEAGRLVVGDTLYATGGAGTICIDR